MKLRPRVVLQLATLCFVLGVYGMAADNAYLYIVHGVPGRDIADNLNPGFPVDVLINGDCMVRGLTFSNIVGPYSFAAGTYEIQVSESNSLAPCTNAPVITSQATLNAGASVSAVAAISGGQATVLTFPDDLAPVAPGKARFVFAQAADAPALQATLTQLDVTNPKTFMITANPGTQQAINVPAGLYLVTVVAQGTGAGDGTDRLAKSVGQFRLCSGRVGKQFVGIGQPNCARRVLAGSGCAWAARFSPGFAM